MNIFRRVFVFTLLIFSTGTIFASPEKVLRYAIASIEARIEYNRNLYDFFANPQIDIKEKSMVHHELTGLNTMSRKGEIGFQTLAKIIKEEYVDRYQKILTHHLKISDAMASGPIFTELKNIFEKYKLSETDSSWNEEDKLRHRIASLYVDLWVQLQEEDILRLKFKRALMVQKFGQEDSSGYSEIPFLKNLTRILNKETLPWHRSYLLSLQHQIDEATQQSRVILSNVLMKLVPQSYSAYKKLTMTQSSACVEHNQHFNLFYEIARHYKTWEDQYKQLKVTHEQKTALINRLDASGHESAVAPSHRQELKDNQDRLELLSILLYKEYQLRVCHFCTLYERYLDQLERALAQQDKTPISTPNQQKHKKSKKRSAAIPDSKVDVTTTPIEEGTAAPAVMPSPPHDDQNSGVKSPPPAFDTHILVEPLPTEKEKSAAVMLAPIADDSDPAAIGLEGASEHKKTPDLDVIRDTDEVVVVAAAAAPHIIPEKSDEASTSATATTTTKVEEASEEQMAADIFNQVPYPPKYEAKKTAPAATRSHTEKSKAQEDPRVLELQQKFLHKNKRELFELFFDDSRNHNQFSFEDVQYLVTAVGGRIIQGGGSHCQIIVVPGGISFSWRPHGKAHASKLSTRCLQGFRRAFENAGITPERILIN